jgi:hypothetical protein
MFQAVIDYRLSHPMTDREVIGDLFQPRDAGHPFVETDNNYVWFRAIGAVYRPKTIVELGSRYGYSLKAFTDGAG